MSEETKPEKPNITQFSWWIDTDRRIWVVHAVWFTGDTPKSVLLLRFGGAELIEQPYEVVQDLVEAESFKQISPIINAQISINSSGGSFTATAY